MKIVFKSNTHQSHYLFLFKISFVTGKQETLTNKNVLIIPKNKFKEVQKETHNNKWGFGALCICNKEPRFLPPCIPPRSAKSLMKIVQKFQLWSIPYRKRLKEKQHIRFLNCSRTVLLCHLTRQPFLLAKRCLRVTKLLRNLFLPSTLYHFLFTLFLIIWCLLRLKQSGKY